MATVYLSIGSNLGDRAEMLREAVALLGDLAEVESLGCSGIYETEPVGCPEGSPVFLNAAVKFDCSLEPEALLDQLQAIERKLGRPDKRAINAPRPVDLDILLIGDLEYSSDRLTIPHPRMQDRAFVLCPLAEIHDRFQEAADRCDQSGVRRLAISLIQ